MRVLIGIFDCLVDVVEAFDKIRLAAAFLTFHDVVKIELGFCSLDLNFVRVKHKMNLCENLAGALNFREDLR